MKQIRIAVMRALLRAGLDLARGLPALQRWLDAAALRIRTPAGLVIVPRQYGSVTGQWIIAADAPTSRCVLYLDGSEPTASPPRLHPFVTRIAAAAGTRIFRSVAADVGDAVAAFHSLRQQGYAAKDITIAGAGRGAGFALSALLALRDADESLPVQALLISPQLDLRGDAASAAGQRGRPASALAVHLHGLPPLLIHAGGDETQLDVTEQLQANAEASGVDVRLRVWPDMGPVFHAFAPYLREADDAIAHLAASLRVCRHSEAAQPLFRATFAPRTAPRIHRLAGHAARGI